MHPTTDIVCLVHNQIEITKGFVKHLFANTENFNLIFVDNNSTDATPKWLEEGRQTQQWQVVTATQNGQRANLGVIGGRNLGVKHTTSDYFMNIDNDQYPGPGWLEKLHQKMSEGYDIVGCEAWKLVPPNGGGVVMIDGQARDRTYFPYKKCSRSGEKFTYIGCGGILIKREVYEEIGLFDERFNPAYFEDPDFCFRAIQAGKKLGWCPECNITHLAHQTFNNQKLFDKNSQFVKSWNLFKEKWNGWFPN